MRPLLVLAALLLSPPAFASEPEWRLASEQEVLLRPFSYEPEAIRLDASRPVRLRLVNNGEVTLIFEAKAFLEAARIRSGDEAKISGGRIRIAPGEHVSIALVPAPGRYHLRSSNLLHRLMGMTGAIIVE